MDEKDRASIIEAAAARIRERALSEMCCDPLSPEESEVYAEAALISGGVIQSSAPTHSRDCTLESNALGIFPALARLEDMAVKNPSPDASPTRQPTGKYRIIEARPRT
jgi:hypothetical protein